MSTLHAKLTLLPRKTHAKSTLIPRKIHGKKSRDMRESTFVSVGDINITLTVLYKLINDRWHTLQLRQKLRLDIRVFCYRVYSTEKQMDAVNIEIEHLLKDIPVILFSQTLQCYCVGSIICSWDGSVCENEITWIFFIQ